MNPLQGVLDAADTRLMGGRHRSALEGDPAWRESEPLLRALLERSGDLVSVVDRDGRLVVQFPSRTVHNSTATRVGRNVLAFVHPEDRAAAQARFAALVASPAGTDVFVGRVRGPDGMWRWMEIAGVNLLDDPVIRGVALHARDVTGRQEAERSLQRRADRFKRLVQHATELILVWNARGEITYASPATVRFALGHEPGEPDNTLEAIKVYLHPDDRDRMEDLVVKLSAEPGATRRTIARFRRFDGRYRSLEVTVTNLLDDPSVRGIVANGRDVTDQLAFEATLRRQEEWFRSLVQHGYEAIAVLDADSTVRYLSPAVHTILGRDPDELASRGLTQILHPSDADVFARRFRTARDLPGVHGPFETRAQHANGTWRWLEVVFTNRLDDPIVNGIVVNFRDVSERHAMEEQLAHQALHDSLTGLPNRTLLRDRLVHALARAHRNHTNVGVLFLDLDGFKYVNDTWGHRAGDELLVVAATRLARHVHGADTVARLGGDEFVVVLDLVANESELLAIGERLCRELAEPIHLDEGSEVTLTASCGASFGRGTTDADDLLRDADTAMYAAKVNGGGTAKLFDEKLRRRVQRRYEIERALRGAIDRDELSLVYQPIVNLQTDQSVGVEALLRWQPAGQSAVGPSGFIDLAEETGLIVPIGLWALETASRQVAAWRARPELRDLYGSVNLSAAQLRVPHLPEQVAAILNDTGLEPSALVLEITETFLVDDIGTCITRLEELRDLGVRLAVDDFGTRYSSLAYLHRLPLDGLKIDRVFVHRLERALPSRAIVAAILAMASTLDLFVVAEGVETAAQATTLAELGCELAQGFYYAVPVDAEHCFAETAGSLSLPPRRPSAASATRHPAPGR